MPPRKDTITDVGTAAETAITDPARVTQEAVTGEGAPAPTLIVDAGTSTVDAAAAGVLAAAGPPIGGTQAIPVPLDGPGAGALQVAERVETTQLRPLDAEGLAPDQRIPRAGGVDPRYDPRSGLPTTGAGRRVLGVFDASRIRGLRYATAARLVEHDNQPYEAGRFIPVTFQQYTDLVAIGAIVADDWDALEDVPV